MIPGGSTLNRTLTRPQRQHRPRHHRLLTALLLLALGPCALLTTPFAHAQSGAFVYQNVAKVVVIGDVHGAYDALVTLLEGAGLIDARQRWSGGATHLVSLGDLLDRGDATQQVLDLFIRLEEEAEAAGGRVHVLLGNHELMNLTGDWRDVTAADIASFAQSGAEDPAVLRRRAFYRYGKYGGWLLQRPVLIRINNRLYTHGGLPSLLLDGPIDKANDVSMNLLRAMVVETETLVNAGVLQPDVKLLELNDSVPRQDGEDPSLRRLRGMIDSPYFGDNGPLWYRGTTSCAAVIEHDLTRAVLEHLGAEGVVVGHMPTWNYRVQVLMGGKVMAVDTGMLTAVYGGAASALQIQGKAVTALGPDGKPGAISTAIFEPFAIERLAAEGTAPDAPLAVTLVAEQPELERPRRFRRDQLVQVRAPAADQAISGWFRKMSKGDIANELAAWRLDRLLGLGLVPDTFAAKLDKANGVVVTLPSTVLTEAQRLEQERAFPNWCERGSSYQAVTVFDALVNQRDRDVWNLAYEQRLTKIRLTEHADSFGTARKPPKTKAPVAISETLRERLTSLSEESLTAALGDLLSKREIRALLKRRDVIVGWPGIAG